MGRAISMENRQDDLDRRLKLVEKELRLTSDALEALAQNGTRVHHVDLTDERNFRAVGVEVTPDETFEKPSKKSKTKKVEKKEKVRVVEQLL